jgi:hypothetical protein
MSDPTITCPNCRTEIKLNESLAGPLIAATRQRYEKIIADKEQAIGAREATLRDRQADIERQKASIEEQISARLKTERETIAAEEAQKAKLRAASDLEHKAKEIVELQEVLKERNVKLEEAQKAQTNFLQKQRELEDALRELDLTVEKRVQGSLAVERDKARQDAEEALKLRMAEKDQQMEGMRKQIEDLKRRAEQGSQQLQGEVQEIELESLLRTRFPRDLIEPVPKGEFGGDVLHRVIGSQNQTCGTILWESKRTKNWSDSWLAKLREDQRAAKAEIALLISSALPKGVVAFDLIDGVWVAETRCALPVAIALRQSLIELAMARDAGEGQQTKVELVYQYLTGPRFRQRVEAIVEKITDMQADLDRERKAMTRLWAKREAQIRGVIESTVGMYGDLQGIAGRSLQEIEGLDLKLLDGPDKTSSEGANDE